MGGQAAVGVGQCRRRCRRRPQAHAAARGCRPRPRRRTRSAARRRRGRVHQGLQRVRRSRTGSRGCARADGRATRRINRVGIAPREYAAAVAQARGRSARHRLAPRRPRAALISRTRPARARHYRALLQRRPCWVVRCDTQASLCRARQCPTLPPPIGTHRERLWHRDHSWSRARTSECTFFPKPTQPSPRAWWCRPTL